MLRPLGVVVSRWEMMIDSVNLCFARPDITEMIDWALKNNDLPSNYLPTSYLPTNYLPNCQVPTYLPKTDLPSLPRCQLWLGQGSGSILVWDVTSQKSSDCLYHTVDKLPPSTCCIFLVSDQSTEAAQPLPFVWSYNFPGKGHS